MIRVVEFKTIEPVYAPAREPEEYWKVYDEITALDQLNEYLALNDKEIDLIEVQTHSDRFVLVYRTIKSEQYKALDELGLIK